MDIRLNRTQGEYHLTIREPDSGLRPLNKALRGYRSPGTVFLLDPVEDWIKANGTWHRKYKTTLETPSINESVVLAIPVTDDRSLLVVFIAREASEAIFLNLQKWDREDLNKAMKSEFPLLEEKLTQERADVGGITG